MFKTIYRTQLQGTVYGHATSNAQKQYLGENPTAIALDPIQVSPDQLARWRCCGQWDDDWYHCQFVPGDSVLRWPEDRPDGEPPYIPTIRQILTAANLTQAALAARFGIPKRTVEDWATEKRTCAPYIRRMMCEILGIQ